MHDAPPALHGAMKTATKAAATGSSHSYTHSHSSPYQTTSISRSSHSHRPSKGGNSTTPLASPRGPFSVGQNHPPKLSPGRGPEARASSPNYFGLVVEASSPQDSSLGRNNWSPPSSSVKSFGAAIPTQVPLDANPEFEAFKRQADFNKSRTFSLPPVQQTPNAAPTSNPGLQRPRPPRWHTHASDTGSDMSFARSVSSAYNKNSSNKMDVDQDSLHDSAYVSADSKRNSESSLYPLSITSNPIRFESPAPMDKPQQRGSLTRAEDRDPRMSVMEHKPEPPSPPLQQVSRAATLPTNHDNGAPAMIMGDELKEMIKSMDSGRLLLLDIRSAQNYQQSRIKGALNLCIPTTLLKRATFNIQKLQQTFQGGSESEKFSKWREADAIVVYDSHSSDQKDAVTAQNMIKKFTNEGYSGRVCILKGGFTVFKESFPKLVENGPPAGSPSKSGGKACHGMAPVIGGVSLPMTAGAPNPFFSNIRQNMDLADGVGQFDVARPTGLKSPLLPTWLRDAASEPDKGKQVSDKFLKIEKDEKSRMQTAYAAFDPNTAQQKQSVQLCGVEKGGKNRYKDILPFEHARVRLQNKPEGSCDYVNASHLRSSKSNKRYIASQGPLPATFEDFWSVVWEQDVRVIVMLTAESEGGQLKCHPYWKQRDHGPIRLKPLSEKKASLDIDKHRADSSVTPSSASSGESGRRRANTMATVETSTPTPKSSTSESETPYVIIRKFALSHAAQPFAPIREITHLHFSSWPDFGTPAQPSHLLALVELANVMQRSALPVATESIVGNRHLKDLKLNWHDEPERDAHARPMMVHCSAGCGRTGTFVAVDSVIDMLKRQRIAKSSRSKAYDFEGDIDMADADVSPRSNKFPRMASHQSSPRIDEGPGASTVDTGFLRDESVDLVSETVEDLREQRLSMVQSLRQFVLCYETILEWEHRVNEKGAAGVKGRPRAGSLAHQPR